MLIHLPTHYAERMEAEEEIKSFESSINEIDRKLVSTKVTVTVPGKPATHSLTYSLTHLLTHSLTHS